MAAPRLRTKLAATAAAAPSEDEDKVKGKGKAAGSEDEENEASDDEGEEGDEPKGKGKAKTKAAAPVTSTDAVAADRARTKAITTSSAGKQLPALASHLAYETGLTALESEAVFAAVLEDVTADASAAPAKPAAEGPKGAAFRRAMEGEAPNPRLGNGVAGGAEAARLMSFSEIRAARADAKRK